MHSTYGGRFEYSTQTQAGAASETSSSLLRRLITSNNGRKSYHEENRVVQSFAQLAHWAVQFAQGLRGRAKCIIRSESPRTSVEQK